MEAGILAPGHLLCQLAVRVEEREGTGISCLGTAVRITGKVVRSLHCLDTEELHEVGSGEGSVQKPGLRILS